jgi:hypothetical protein
VRSHIHIERQRDGCQAAEPRQTAPIVQGRSSLPGTYEAFQQQPGLRHGLSVPVFYRWAHPADQAFRRSGIANPDQGYGLVSQRIPPVPKSFRQHLVNTLCRNSLKLTSLRSEENADCLVRLYLGRRNNQSKRTQTELKLRNFPLHVNEMPLLGIDPAYIARVLARSLAVLHWMVQTDANDVEFVLGAAPEHDMPVPTRILDQMQMDDILNLDSRDELVAKDLRIWLLDFNQCETSSVALLCTEDASIEPWTKTLVDGFFWNDPYASLLVQTSDEHC